MSSRELGPGLPSGGARSGPLSARPEGRPPGAILGLVRSFNTTGLVRASRHYCIPPLERVDLDEILDLIRQEKYFVLHAPRQSGKTSTLLALRDLLNSGSEGDFRSVYASLEAGRTVGEDVGRAAQLVLDELADAARSLGDRSLEGLWREVVATAAPDAAVKRALSRWAEADPRPLVLLLDEVDSLTGVPLLSLLSQLRSGYLNRPRGFPQSVVLCGIRDVRDYRAPGVAASPFNIKAESLRLGDFSEAETRALLGQHTEETGQRFDDEALELVWDQTRGQPWLVNALAHDACFRHKPGRDRSRPITAPDIRDARERLILRRETHLGQLAEKLREGRVRRVIEPILSGEAGHEASRRDIEYARDLGLIAPRPPLRVANPIYGEVIPRELTSALDEGLTERTAWYVGADGGLLVEKLMASLQRFFRETGEHWAGRFDYAEAGPQLILQGFLHRIVNGGGRLEREYGIGRGRTDLLIVWPRGGGEDRFAVECKVAHTGRDRAVRDGLRQTAGYLDRLGSESGHLVVFDRNPAKSWEEKIYRRAEEYEGKAITVWGM